MASKRGEITTVITINQTGHCFQLEAIWRNALTKDTRWSTCLRLSAVRPLLKELDAAVANKDGIIERSQLCLLEFPNFLERRTERQDKTLVLSGLPGFERRTKNGNQAMNLSAD
ncbi:hypothetical protein EVAR_81136_1 [Eumeta japonica]|uniref:Uncharacterized protein n=1 Tax=Eumeta variegata TaxID=151549 RepID=A0A4C1UK04_EUMVA|nr:hypothetical protein EVAR_81136_1 [Eumeta japonica]